MGYSCCVPKCRTGYKLKKGDGAGTIPKVPLFKFPKEMNLRKKWIEAIPRKCWTVSDNHRVCAKHFSPDDLTTNSRDTNSTRRSLREIQTLSRIRPKPGVVPHIFHVPKRKNSSTELCSSSKCVNKCSSTEITGDNEFRQLQNSTHSDIFYKDDFSTENFGNHFSSSQVSSQSSLLDKDDFSLDSWRDSDDYSPFHDSSNSLERDESSKKNWCHNNVFSQVQDSGPSPMPDPEFLTETCTDRNQSKSSGKEESTKRSCSYNKHFSQVRNLSLSILDREEFSTQACILLPVRQKGDSSIRNRSKDNHFSQVRVSSLLPDQKEFSTESCANRSPSSPSQEVKTLSELKDKIHIETLPSGYTIVLADDSLQFHFIETPENVLEPPQLVISVIVTENLELFAFVKSKAVPRRIYEDTLPTGLIQNTCQVVRILAVCMRLYTNGDQNGDISFVVSLLENYLTLQTNSIAPQRADICLLRLIVEQLKLSRIRPQDRHYSTETLMIAFLWRLTSPTLYMELRKLFALPSLSHLDQLSCEMAIEPRVMDLDHIRRQVKYLNTQERIATLFMDVVCTPEISQHGPSDLYRSEKIVLTFTVQSLYSRFKDIVCLWPMERLDTSLLRQGFEFVMQALHEFFLVIALSVGDHICFRELFIDLCGGELRTSIEHPICVDEELFLLNDFTHTLISIYDDFVNKRQMNPPTMGHESILGKSSFAELDHIIRLYGVEEGSHLKSVFLPREESSSPSRRGGITCTSPRDALCIFSKSTAYGLEAVGKNCHMEFLETARYVKFIEMIWRILSVKNISRVTGKRDPYCMPLQEMENGHPGEIYLKEAITIFKEWQLSGRAGLASETFTACIQTMTAVLALSKYLQRRHGVKYFLTGKVMSDPSDVRFSMYR